MGKSGSNYYAMGYKYVIPQIRYYPGHQVSISNSLSYPWTVRTLQIVYSLVNIKSPVPQLQDALLSGNWTTQPENSRQSPVLRLHHGPTASILTECKAQYQRMEIFTSVVVIKMTLAIFILGSLGMRRTTTLDFFQVHQRTSALTPLGRFFIL